MTPAQCAILDALASVIGNSTNARDMETTASASIAASLEQHREAFVRLLFPNLGRSSESGWLAALLKCSTSGENATLLLSSDFSRWRVIRDINRPPLASGSGIRSLLGFISPRLDEYGVMLRTMGLAALMALEGKAQ